MCGVSGGVSKKPLNIDKLKILGIYNVTRGTDSCGMALNNEVVKGVGTVSNFTNFIEEKIINTRESDENYTVLIHTRNASNKSTKEDLECAHPFEIKNKKGKVVLIGMHNGVISNETEIATKYGVKEEKVDSKTLLSIIAKAKNDDKMYDVLKDYEGAAVLVWYYPEEPNTIFLWKGASKKWANSTELEEERPLYLYRVKDDNGKFTDEFYFSSIKESLLAIGGDAGFRDSDVDKEPSIKSVESNCIIKITPGEKYKIRVIKRVQESNNYGTTYYSHMTKPAGKINVKTPKKNLHQANKESMLRTFVNYPFKKIKTNIKLGSNDCVLIDNEPFIHDFHTSGNKVYFLRGRYWQNGHMIGGTEKNNYVTREIDIDGYPKDHKLCDVEGLDTYYFFQGLLLQGKKDAEEVKALCDSGTIWKQDKKELNLNCFHKNVYGFCQNIDDTSGLAKESNEMWANGTYYPMFDYDRKYVYKNGYFQHAEYTKVEAKEKIKMFTAFETKEKIVEEPKVISLPLTHPRYSSAISEAATAITEVEEDIIYNHCYDALSSMKATLKELAKVKSDEKYKRLNTLFTSTYNAISTQLKTIEKKGDDVEEENELTTEKGPLYS